MKTYKVIKSEGNINGWSNPQEAGTVNINEAQAEILNAQKDNTGIEYIEVDPKAKKEAPKAEAIPEPVVESEVVAEVAASEEAPADKPVV